MSTKITKLTNRMRSAWLCVSSIVVILLFATLTGNIRRFHIEEPDKIILNHEHLNPLFDTLMAIKQGKEKSISILHIGDSHIQGYFLTDRIRNQFYAEFGLANKGLAFPFQVAKTNSMAEIRSSSVQAWESRKNTQLNFAPNIGICGRTILTYTPNSSISLRMPAGCDNFHFNEISVLYTPVNSACKIKLKDSTGAVLEKVTTKNEKGFIAETYKSKNRIHKVNLDFSHSGILHGVVLNNSNNKSGVSYHVAGINGSQYKNWSMSNLLAKQSTYLKPDLIVISLGTNDGNDYTLTAEVFTSYLHSLVNSLKQANPNARFILTTPPDSYYKRKYDNKHINVMRGAIMKYAAENNIACWDLYCIMGGENSIKTWLEQGYASTDLIHFTKTGYELQGDLFYQSFIKHYNNYVSDRSK